MEWLTTALFALAAALPATGSTQPPTGGKWMLEATIPLPQVCAVAASPEAGAWAAASAYESWLFQGTSKTGSGPLRARSGLQFTGGGKGLAALGDHWDAKRATLEASKPKARLASDFDIASALVLPGDTVMAAFVTAVRRKGDPILVPAPSEGPRNQVLLLDLRTGNVLHTLAEDVRMAEEMQFAVHGHLLACAHERLMVWDVRTGDTISNQPIGDAALQQRIAFYPDGSLLIAADPHTGASITWDAATWKPLWRGQLAGSGIRRVVFGSSPGQLFFASQRGGLYSCQVSQDGKPGTPVSIATGEVLDFAIDADGRRVYVAGGGKVRIYKFD